MNATRDRAVASGIGRSETMDAQWLDLDVVADVAIVAGGRRVTRAPGMWSADSPGEQMIEIRFHKRTPVRRLRVVSSEVKESRTQEMTIWVSLRGGERHREVLRQQFNFSPNGATEEVEEYPCSLKTCQPSSCGSSQASIAGPSSHTYASCASPRSRGTGRHPCPLYRVP